MSVVAYTSVSIDLSDVERGLAAAGRSDILKGAFKALKIPLRFDQATHAQQYAGPEGGWPGKAPATFARHGRKPSRVMGRLPTAVSYAATATGVSATSRVAWSGGAISEGGRIGRGAILPARPFLWISDEMMQIAEDKISEAALAAYGGQS